MRHLLALLIYFLALIIAPGCSRPAPSARDANEKPFKAPEDKAAAPTAPTK